MGAEVERKGRIDVGRAFKLRMSGLSYQEIGNALGGFSDSGICDALQSFTRLLDSPEMVNTYRENEAEVLDAVRAKLITSLADDLAVKKGKGKLSGYQKVGMYGILFDKMRLLRNESTANVSNLTAIIQAAIGAGPAATTPSVSEGEIVDSVPDNEAEAKPSKRID